MYPAAARSHSPLLLPGAASRQPPSPTKPNKGPAGFKHHLSSVVQGQRDYLDDRSKSNAGYSNSDRSAGASYGSKVQQQQPLPPRQPINNRPYSGRRSGGSGMPSTSYSTGGGGGGRPSYRSQNNYANPHSKDWQRGQRQDNIELEDDVFSLTPSHV